MFKELSVKIGFATLAALVVACVGVQVDAAEPCLVYEEPVVLGKVSTRRLDEISGLAVSRKNPDVMWVHNDAGGDNRIYAVALDGEYLGRWDLEGVAADDFEDIAYGPCADGEDGCLYIGDFGNNEGKREKFQVYRIPEPEFDLEDARDDPLKEEIDKDFIEKIRFRYPFDFDEDEETPDAEAMMVDSDGVIYIFTKWKEGTELLRLDIPEDLDDRVTLDEVGVRFDFFRTTGADLAASGDHFVVRNLDEAREFIVYPGQSLGDAFTTNDYLSISVGHEKQGEAIGYTADGLSILTTSERDKEPIYLYECAIYGELDPSSGKADEVEPSAVSPSPVASDDGCSIVSPSSPSTSGLIGALGALVIGLATWRRR